MNDVAARAGVSKSLVSLVLRNSPHVSQARRDAVLKAIDQLGYRPNTMARSLVERRSHIVGVVISDMRNPWYVELVENFQLLMSERGMSVLLGNGRLDTRTDESLVEAFLRLRVDGLFLVGSLPMTGAIVASARSVPTVAGSSRDMNLPRVDTVVNDDLLGASLAVDHLVALGHRRIAHLGGRGGSVAGARRAGYEGAMSRHRLGHETRTQWCDFTEKSGFEGTLKLLRARHPPSAIVGLNDVACIGALSAADELGVKVPAQLSLVGYDNTSLAAMRRISLTSIDPMNGTLGRAAAEMLLQRIQDQGRPATERLVRPRLVARATSAPPG
ncbi:MAG: LacI family DNA-binding transcriptional regulator [Acidimicrobiales bacterium]